MQTWKKVARKEKLSQKAIEKLAKNNVVITDTAYKQIFTPYLKGSEGEDDISLFITTDSLINAYHVLYEESVFRLENENSNKLGEILRFVLANFPKTVDDIKGKPELVKAACRRAMIVVGTAMRLLDEKYKLDDSNIEKIVAEELEKIEQAEAKERPSWLGVKTYDLLEIDYSRYKPRSFYTSSEQLSKYFRAVSWLQSIPFRLSKDDELLSILMLGNCMAPSQFAGDSNKQREYTDFFSTFKMFIGSGDDWDVITAKDQIENGLSLNLNENDLDKIREKLLKKLESEGGSQIYDHVCFLSLDSNSVAEPQFRFISAYRTPGAVLFQKTTDIRNFERDFPNGLEICAALGSDFARSRLNYSDKDKLLTTIDEAKSEFFGDSLYLDYMQCLSCLFNDLPVNSPDFMKKSTWQAKSCNTALAGWSQLGHTWLLQAKEGGCYLAISFVPTGFVEPNPEFYNKMAILAQKTKEILNRAGVLETGYRQMSDDIMFFADLAEKSNSTSSLQDSTISMTEKECQRLEIGDELIYRLQPLDGETESEYYSQKNIRELKKIAQDLLKGILPEAEDLQMTIKKYDFGLKVLWDSFENLCKTLEEISRKQLEGKDLKEYEYFIKDYGKNLARIMLYNSNSYEVPNDDAMRIADVYYNPMKPKGYLQAGIARPRAIYVLYLWQGRLVLCKGAVMPYYEFTSGSRLTDAEWKNLLDSPQRPGVPEWVKPVLSENNLFEPAFDRN